MTLVMTAGIGSLFTVMTSDERIAYNVNGHLMPTNERMVKTNQITDFVLFGWGGDYDISLKIKDELSELVTSNDTLDVCKKHLEKVTNEIKFDRGAVIVLSGFYADGSSGMVMKRSDGETNSPVQELKMNELEYRFLMIPPTGDYSDRQNELLYIKEFSPNYIIEELPKLGIEKWLKRSIALAVNHLIKIHGMISYEEKKATTTEGFYYLIYKDRKGMLRTASGEYDTSQIHEQLRMNEA